MTLRLDDLVANRTLSPEIAHVLRATVAARRSFLVMAVPRLAGKTTTMQAMLAESRGPVLALGYDGDDVADLVTKARGGYLVVPEVAPGPYAPGYVWGAPVRRAFAGIARGTALATALHAPDPESAFAILCQENKVPDADAARLAIVVYMRALGPQTAPTRRVVETVHEILGVTKGRPDARLLFRWHERGDRFEQVAPDFELLAFEIATAQHHHVKHEVQDWVLAEVEFWSALNDGRPSSPSTMSSPSITVSFGMF